MTHLSVMMAPPHLNFGRESYLRAAIQGKSPRDCTGTPFTTREGVNGERPQLEGDRNRGQEGEEKAGELELEEGVDRGLGLEGRGGLGLEGRGEGSVRTGLLELESGPKELELA